MINHFGGIIWDWNGTLLDDALLCVRTMNQLLEKRHLPLLSLERYTDVFSFPVKEYYRKIGFDFELEPFEIPALEFINQYNSQVSGCLLHHDAFKILTHFKTIGARQFVLSAMKQDSLNDCLDHHRISSFFECVSGLDNHFAASKTENGHRLLADMQLDRKTLVLVGDTVHDFEVAVELGCQCVLIANGHQSRKVLLSTGANVVNSLSDLLIVK